MTTSLPIWAIMGKQQKKFVLILAQTMPQAKQHLKNIKDELERNTLLRNDLGPFQEETDEWRSYSLVIPKYNARITAASIDQSVRGMKHGAHRPDLIILDDVEDLNSVKTQEMRDKTYNWVMSEVMPVGDKNTRFVFVGNLLHEDSLLMRIKKLIEDNKMNGIYRAYPIVDGNENIAWPGKYPSMNDVEDERRKTANDVAYQREYMLKIIPGDDWVVRPEWIHYYKQLPMAESRNILTGIDLAISKGGDYTAMVSVKIYGYDDNMKIYVLPNIFNERIEYPAQVEACIIRSNSLSEHPTTLCIENVGYQAALLQTLNDKNIPVKEMKPGGLDKVSRLKCITHMLKNATVLLPEDEEAKPLIRQLIGMGVEKYDDLADAFVYAILAAIENNRGGAIPAMLPESMKY
jgi:phage terminase large subunit-like protein